MLLKLSIPQLQNSLTKLGFFPQIEEKSGHLYLGVKHSHIEFVLFFRIIEEGNLLQILTYLPIKVKKESYPDLARFLHALNRNLEIPGLCLDEASNLVFFRVSIPCLQGRYEEDLVDTYIRNIPKICSTCHQVITQVAEQTRTFEDFFHQLSQDV